MLYTGFEVNGFFISTDKDLLDISVIHNYLCVESYWAKGIPVEVVKNSIEHSLCFGIYTADKHQVGFARVISDQATYGYLCDVFVLEAFRGKGLSKWLMAYIHHYPTLLGLRRWGLATADAHELYKQFNWQPLANPNRLMEIVVPNIYATNRDK